MGHLLLSLCSFENEIIFSFLSALKAYVVQHNIYDTDG